MPEEVADGGNIERGAPDKRVLAKEDPKAAPRVTYCCMLHVPRELILYVAGLLRAERRRRGTRRGTRALTPFHQARFMLAWFRDRCDPERLGAGFGFSRATAYRYLAEAIAVLSG